MTSIENTTVTVETLEKQIESTKEKLNQLKTKMNSLSDSEKKQQIKENKKANELEEAKQLESFITQTKTELQKLKENDTDQ
jgi:phage shock protein A